MLGPVFEMEYTVPLVGDFGDTQFSEFEVECSDSFLTNDLGREPFPLDVLWTVEMNEFFMVIVSTVMRTSNARLRSNQ